MEKIYAVLTFILILSFGYCSMLHDISNAGGKKTSSWGPGDWQMNMDMNNTSLASFWGEDSHDRSGFSISGVGDVNGDEYDDILIGAYGDEDGGGFNAGQTYLILGKASGWSMDTDLSATDASFIGEDAEDSSGNSLSGAGDVNGDGYDDLLIGAIYDNDGGSQAGQTYLILGKASGWSMDMDLSNADASFIGEDAEDYSGKGVSSAGDVNGDGYDDILIGAQGDEDGGSNAGQTYLIFGKASGWSMDTDLSNADASFIGEDAIDRSGSSVSGAGDVNGDGYDDILIGALHNNHGGSDAGQTYLIFGKASGWSMDTDLSNADASFIGEDQDDWSGSSVSGAGDVNGDGYDDILIGAKQCDFSAGQTYLILGKASDWAMDMRLSSADASFIGEAYFDSSGCSVSSAGDVNDDGFDDILIGAYGNEDGGGRNAGQTYLIYGKASGWSMDTDLSNSDASFWGEDSGDYSGRSVSGAGDVNGDGTDDILIGAPSDDDGGNEAGQTYLIEGIGNIHFKKDYTPRTATTGDDLTFSVKMNETLLIQSVFIEYWFGDGYHTKVSMTNLDNSIWIHSIVIPFNSLDDLYYNFSTPIDNNKWSNTERKNITIMDNDKPSFGVDHSDVCAYTGDPYLFLIEALDNINVDSVNIEYWFCDGKHFSLSATPRTGNKWAGEILIPLNSLEPLHYGFTIFDSSNNRNNTPHKSVPIFDNKKPEFISSVAPANSTTGEVITLSVEVIDNIEVQDVCIEYWYGNGPITNSSLEKLGENTWLKEIKIIDSIETLHYVLKACDSSNNWNQETINNVPIVDNDDPEFGEDTSDVIATTGGSFTFRIGISDNIELSRGYVKYWCDEEESLAASLLGEEIFISTVTVPSNWTSLWYTFHAVDHAENQIATEPKKIIVLDVDPPSFLDDLTLDTCQTGEELFFSVKAADNIALSIVKIEYWYGDGIHESFYLDLDDDHYTGTLNIKIDYVGPMFYKIEMVDRSGNSNETDPFEVMIIDNIPPSLEKIEDINIYEGEELTISVEAKDNIGIVLYKWTGAPIDVNGAILIGRINEVGTFVINIHVEDREGNSNFTSFILTVLPTDHDMDQDGIPDLIEMKYGLDLKDASDSSGDLDNDGLTNLEEFGLGTEIDNNDTDGDGFLDGYEVKNDFDPLDPLSGEEPTSPDDEDSNVVIWIVIVLIVIIITIAIAASVGYVLYQRKKAEEITDDSTENIPMEPTIPRIPPSPGYRSRSLASPEIREKLPDSTTLGPSVKKVLPAAPCATSTIQIPQAPHPPQAPPKIPDK